MIEYPLSGTEEKGEGFIDDRPLEAAEFVSDVVPDLESLPPV